jgi:hypothetical protein
MTNSLFPLQNKCFVFILYLITCNIIQDVYLQIRWQYFVSILGVGNENEYK